MNDLLKELDALTPEVLDQNELRNSRRKAPWVKIYNEFEADTTFSEGVGRDGKKLLLLNWTNMHVLDADTPYTGTEDSDEFPVSDRANSKLGFLIKSLKGAPLSSIDGKRVHYKLGLWQQKNADGSVRLNDKGFPAYELWYWEVVGNVAGSNGAKPEAPTYTDAQLDEAAGMCAGLASEAALAALTGAGYVGNDMLAALVMGSTKRLRQVDGVYELVG